MTFEEWMQVKSGDVIRWCNPVISQSREEEYLIDAILSSGVCKSEFNCRRHFKLRYRDYSCLVDYCDMKDQEKYWTLVKSATKTTVEESICNID